MQENLPDGLKQIRKCRICHKVETPLVFLGDSGDARPLFFEEGNYGADILFILEAPNKTDTFEADKGRMTFGDGSDRTGEFVEDCLRLEIGVEPEDTMMTNSVLCLPALDKEGKHTPKMAQLKKCSHNLRRIIDTVDPKVVITVGGKALEATNLIAHHGLTRLVDVVARPIDWYGRTLFPLYHPSWQVWRYRSLEQQRDDYRALRELMIEKGILPSA